MTDEIDWNKNPGPQTNKPQPILSCGQIDGKKNL